MNPLQGAQHVCSKIDRDFDFYLIEELIATPDYSGRGSTWIRALGLR